MAEIQPVAPQPADGSSHDEVEASRMTLGEHLEELRSRLIKSVLAIAVSFAVCWGFRYQLDVLVQRPYQLAKTELNEELVRRAEVAIDADGADGEVWKEWYEESGYPDRRVLTVDRRIPPQMKGDGTGTGFFYLLKVSFYFALIIGGPVLLWQMWAFIAAGLYGHEKKVIHRYFPWSVALFFGGVVFGYLMLIPNALYFLAIQTIETIQWYQSIDNYWSFLVSLTLALGLVFQLPIVMLGVARMGLVDPKVYGRYRAHMIVGSLIIGALITPPDPFTQMMMAIPIAVLYEIGHIVSRMAVKKPVERKPKP